MKFKILDTGDIAVVMFFAVSFLSTFFILYFIYKSKKEKYDTIKYAITNKYPNINLLFSKGYSNRQLTYISSIKKIAVATALLLPCFFEMDKDIKIILLSVGSFLMVYGAGMLLLFRGKNENEDNDADNSNKNKELPNENGKDEITPNTPTSDMSEE